VAKKHVLIADDDKKCLMLLRHLLQDAGYEVDEASGGSEVIRRLGQGSYDLLLLDFDMKDIKGDRISLMLRMDHQYEALPILMVTGHAEKSEHVFKEYGATEVIYKPFENSEFLSKVRLMLGEER
jgi:DNA-binding response OmpR family regulator